MRFIVFIVITLAITPLIVNAKSKTEKIHKNRTQYTNIENGGPTCGIANGEFKKAIYTKKEKEANKFTINVSAYTAAADECGKSDGITASGKKVKVNRTLACPREYAFGTKIHIEGMGTYICEDRGGAIKGNKFDIYMETKQEAFAFGRQTLTAYIIS